MLIAADLRARRATDRWPGVRRLVLVLAGVFATTLTAACGSQVSPGPDASAVVSSLGAVPVPTAPTVDPTPTASGTHIQLLAMGAAVHAELADGAQATVTATGPDQDPTATSLARTSATITVTVATTTGAVTLDTADLLCRDDTGATISLTPVGPPTARIVAGTTGNLAVKGVFRSGSAQLTWKPTGHPLALWDFNIELG